MSARPLVTASQATSCYFLMAVGVPVVQLDASTTGAQDVARAVVAAIKDPWMRGR